MQKILPVSLQDKSVELYRSDKQLFADFHIIGLPQSPHQFGNDRFCSHIFSFHDTRQRLG